MPSLVLWSFAPDATMQLEIITPDKQVYAGQAHLVQLPGSEGLFELLNNHAPIIASLRSGRVKVHDADGVRFFETGKGVIEALRNKVIVLVESAR